MNEDLLRFFGAIYEGLIQRQLNGHTWTKTETVLYNQLCLTFNKHAILVEKHIDKAIGQFDEGLGQNPPAEDAAGDEDTGE
jgi:hypothetical protein